EAEAAEGGGRGPGPAVTSLGRGWGLARRGNWGRVESGPGRLRRLGRPPPPAPPGGRHNPEGDTPPGPGRGGRCSGAGRGPGGGARPDGAGRGGREVEVPGARAGQSARRPGRDRVARV